MTDPEAPLEASDEAPPAESGVEVDWADYIETGYNPQPVQALQIETSFICNFRCNSCPLSMSDYDRPEKHMQLDEFRRILDAFPTAKKIELQGIGEVFLNPGILDIIREASGRGIDVHTFSNASMLDKETCHGLVRAGLGLINLSMDGADEETFRKLRKGGTLARYIEGATNLVQARAELGTQTPRIGAMTVLSKRNYRQIPKMLEIVEEIGVDTIIFTKINEGPNPELRDILLGQKDRLWIEALPPHEGNVEVVWAYKAWTKKQRMECYWPRHMAYITVDGDVTPCCNYYDGRHLSLGNVFEKPGAEIWNDTPYREFRKRLAKGDLPEKCTKC